MTLNFIRKDEKVCLWSPSAAINGGVIDGWRTNFTYRDEDKVDNRTAFGKALKDLGDKNISQGQLVACL